MKSPVASGLSAPLAVQTMNSPLHVVASGFSGLPVTAMQIYLDGTLVYTVNANAIDTSVAATPGAHAFVIKAWDNSGRSFSSNFSVTVNAPPIAALTVNSTSLLVGGSITASAAGSTDADGTIASTTINFGDGTVFSGASGTHQYTAAGTYTVTATVTDNAGASSSKSQNIYGETTIHDDHQPDGNQHHQHIAGHCRYFVVWLSDHSDADLRGWRA